MTENRIGDIIAHTQGGYLHDGITAAMAGSWLRGRGRELGAAQRPWFLAVNLVNAHDVMFYDTDAPGTPVRPARGITHVARDPVDPLYAAQWQFELPASHAQPLDAPGRPAAHRDFLRSHDALVGAIPNEPDRWRRRHNYYLNCLRDADRNIASVLAELDAAGLSDRTIIVPTADHGDMDGAHQLHAKGAVAYREQKNVPLTDVYGTGTDTTGNAVIGTATFDADGAITAISVHAGTKGFHVPFVNIVDHPTLCGGNGQPACGTGAAATATLDLTTLAGGIRKFVDSLPGVPGATPFGANISASTSLLLFPKSARLVVRQPTTTKSPWSSIPKKCTRTCHRPNCAVTCR